MVEHGNRRSIIRSEEAITWMEQYFNLIGDHMPDKNQIHLPSWETQKSIYSRYVDDMADQGIETDEVVALSSFYRIWSTRFSHVCIPEVSHSLYVQVIMMFQLHVAYNLQPQFLLHACEGSALAFILALINFRKIGCTM